MNPILTLSHMTKSEFGQTESRRHFKHLLEFPWKKKKTFENIEGNGQNAYI